MKGTIAAADSVSVLTFQFFNSKNLLHLSVCILLFLICSQFHTCLKLAGRESLAAKTSAVKRSMSTLLNIGTY